MAQKNYGCGGGSKNLAAEHTKADIAKKNCYVRFPMASQLSLRFIFPSPEIKGGENKAPGQKQGRLPLESLLYKNTKIK